MHHYFTEENISNFAGHNNIYLCKCRQVIRKQSPTQREYSFYKEMFKNCINLSNSHNNTIQCSDESVIGQGDSSFSSPFSNLSESSKEPFSITNITSLESLPFSTSYDSSECLSFLTTPLFISPEYILFNNIDQTTFQDFKNTKFFKLKNISLDRVNYNHKFQSQECQSDQKIQHECRYDKEIQEECHSDQKLQESDQQEKDNLNNQIRIAFVIDIKLGNHFHDDTNITPQKRVKMIEKFQNSWSTRNFNFRMTGGRIRICSDDFVVDLNKHSNKYDITELYGIEIENNTLMETTQDVKIQDNTQSSKFNHLDTQNEINNSAHYLYEKNSTDYPKMSAKFNHLDTQNEINNCTHYLYEKNSTEDSKISPTPDNVYYFSYRDFRDGSYQDLYDSFSQIFTFNILYYFKDSIIEKIGELIEKYGKSDLYRNYYLTNTSILLSGDILTSECGQNNAMHKDYRTDEPNNYRKEEQNNYRTEEPNKYRTEEHNNYRTEEPNNYTKEGHNNYRKDRLCKEYNLRNKEYNLGNVHNNSPVVIAKLIDFGQARLKLSEIDDDGVYNGLCKLSKFLKKLQ